MKSAYQKIFFKKIKKREKREKQEKKRKKYIKLLISEMKLRVLNIDVLLMKVSITDGRRLILHYILLGFLSFFMATILKTIH